MLCHERASEFALSCAALHDAAQQQESQHIKKVQTRHRALHQAACRPQQGSRPLSHSETLCSPRHMLNHTRRLTGGGSGLIKHLCCVETGCVNTQRDHTKQDATDRHQAARVSHPSAVAFSTGSLQTLEPIALPCFHCASAAGTAAPALCLVRLPLLCLLRLLLAPSERGSSTNNCLHLTCVHATPHETSNPASTAASHACFPLVKRITPPCNTHTRRLGLQGAAAFPPVAVVAAAASAAHAGLCRFHCAFRQPWLQNRAVWHPPHRQLRPDTRRRSKGPDMLKHSGLLHTQGTANEHSVKPVARYSCTAASRAASSGCLLRVLLMTACADSPICPKCCKMDSAGSV